MISKGLLSLRTSNPGGLDFCFSGAGYADALKLQGVNYTSGNGRASFRHLHFSTFKFSDCFTAGSGDYADLVKERGRRKDVFTILEPLSDYIVEYLTWTKTPT